MGANFALLKKVLSENPKRFPAKVEVIAGKTLYFRKNGWWKAIVLVKTKYGQTEKDQLRLYGWQWSKKDKRYKQRQKFNISPSHYLSRIILVLQTFLQETFQTKAPTVIEKLAKEIENLQVQLDKSRKASEKNQIPIMTSKIKEFEKMLKNKKTKEKTLQKFIYKNWWFFGSKYKNVHKEKAAGMKGRNDFLLEKNDGYYDIVELKRANVPLFNVKKAIMSNDLKDALSQMAKYVDYYCRHYLDHKDITKIDVLYPTGIIIIGRRKNNEKQALKYHQAILHQIELQTYDDLLDSAIQTIKSITKRKK